MRKLFFLHYLLLQILPFDVFAQKMDYVWLSGYDSKFGFDTLANYWFGISKFDFKQNPVAMSRDSMGINFGRGGCMISDTSGSKLLFSTNGYRINNGNDELMENGDSIGWSVRDKPSGDYYFGRRYNQGRMCINYPNDYSKYFLVYQFFDTTATTDVFNKNMQFALIDVQANQGKGSVMFKDSVIANGPFTGTLSACRHGNGKDWWVVTNTMNTNCLVFLKTDSTGLAINNTICNGIKSINEDIAPLRFSPDGKYLAAGAGSDAALNFFDFDRCTGKLLLKDSIRNVPELNFYDSSFYFLGMEFSPNSRFLYTFSQRFVLQWDMWADTISKSKKIVARGSGFNYPFFHGQLAPDGKIYINQGSTSPKISIIERPDEPDTACRVVQDVFLPTYINGLPHYPNYRLGAANCGGVGVAEVASSKLQLGLFPNPASAFVTIDYGNYHWTEESRLKIELSDATGRVVYESALPMYSGLHRIAVQYLAAGLYYVALSDNGRVIANERFVKE